MLVPYNGTKGSGNIPGVSLQFYYILNLTLVLAVPPEYEKLEDVIIQRWKPKSKLLV